MSTVFTGGSADMTHREPGLRIILGSPDEAVSWGRAIKQRAVFWIEKGGLTHGTTECILDESRRAVAWFARMLNVPPINPPREAVQAAIASGKQR